MIPARNEAEILSTTLPTILKQDHPGPFRVVLVDDRSEDGTAAVARAAAAAAAAGDRLEVVDGGPLPAGWSGKVWAMHQGIEARPQAELPDFLWFTDADVAHEPWVLGALIAKAEAERRAALPLDDLGKRSQWRDRRLMALSAHMAGRLAAEGK